MHLAVCTGARGGVYGCTRGRCARAGMCTCRTACVLRGVLRGVLQRQRTARLISSLKEREIGLPAHSNIEASEKSGGSVAFEWVAVR